MGAHYDIFYRDVLIAAITVPDNRKWRYDLNIYGIHYLETPQDELLITCAIEDVRVVKNGEDRTLTIVHEATWLSQFQQMRRAVWVTEE